jgi:predicted porin
LSYIPDTSEAGQVTPGATFGDEHTAAAGDAQDVFSGGLNYKGQFQEIGVNLSATGQFGEAAEVVGTPEEDLRSYAFGGSLTWRGFTFGGSWGTWEDSLEVEPSTNRDKDFWDLGLAYDFGAFGASVSYFQSDIEDGVGTDHEFNNLVVGLDYALAPGLVPYVEVGFFEFDEAGASLVSPTADNDGTVFLIGTELTF